MSGPEKTGGDFWSRRKAAVREAEAKETAEAQAEETAALQAEAEEKTDEQILEELGLPDPDEMKEGDDFSAFLAAAVPQNLRRRALRRLWAVNPVLANLDGLIEYGEDYTDKATVIENLQTTYQVGKGMLEHVMKLAEAEKQEEAGQSPAEGDGPAEDSASGNSSSDGEIAGEETENDLLTGSNLPLQSESGENVASDKEETQAAAGEMEDAGQVIPRRRMRFTYS